MVSAVSTASCVAAGAVVQTRRASTTVRVRMQQFSAQYRPSARAFLRHEGAGMRHGRREIPGAWRGRKALGSIRGKDLFDLVGVVQVVTRVQADDVLHGLDTTLGMYPLVFPLFRRQGLEQRRIRLAQH